jgi:hypothetical protein
LDAFSSFSVEQLISYGKKTAVASFLVGSLILFIYYLTNYNTIIYFSLFFVISAFIVNGYFFFQLIMHLFRKSILKNKIVQTLAIMLLNIPIGWMYFEIGFHIYSSALTN